MAKDNYCFLNGKFLRETDARISVNDIGLLRGYGVFDVLRTYHAKPFLLKDHLIRLRFSAKNIGLSVPYTNQHITILIGKLLKLNKFEESLIKIVVTGGETTDGITPGEFTTFLILCKKISDSDLATILGSGVKLITNEYLRVRPEVKSLNYVNLISLRKVIKRQRAYNVLYVQNSRVLEAATCNIFTVKGKLLKTPKSDVLYGITRKVVMKIAAKEFNVKEEDIKFDELLKSDEVFITSTTKGIIPVVTIDNHVIGNGKPGIITQKLINLFNQFVSNSI
jgi:branched-chain amino acid aminotransferase